MLQACPPALNKSILHAEGAAVQGHQLRLQGRQLSAITAIAPPEAHLNAGSGQRFLSYWQNLSLLVLIWTLMVLSYHAASPAVGNGSSIAGRCSVLETC